MAAGENDWENILFAEPKQNEQPARALVAATA